MAIIEVLTSALASTACGWRGTRAGAHSHQPEKLLQLYEYEGCPYCRLVRQVLTELDLDAIIYPCPRGGRRWRPQAEAIGGRQQFPLLIDDNTQTRCYESADIIAYLRERYAAGSNRGGGSGPLARAGAGAATLRRGGAGVQAGASEAPEHLLELYSFESSPYARLVRETLCDLELAYVLRNMGKAVNADLGPPWLRERFFPNKAVQGRNRKRMVERTGRMQVPYLVDPNTGVRMYESADIVRYLRATYQR